MYHEAKLFSHSYYDTIQEMPQMAKVYYPDTKEPVEMTAEQVAALDNEGWYTVMHSCNYGVCDHWTSEKPSTWVKEKFNHIIRYVNDKNETVGYNRAAWGITLTKDAHVFKAAVWNS